MADTVTSTTLVNNKKRFTILLTNQSDGTGESGVVKVDKSTLTSIAGVEPSKITVERIEGVCDGMRVDLYWDRTADVLIATLAERFCWDFDDVGGLHDSGSGGTGDIILSTNGHTSGDSYMIRLDCRLEV